MEILEKADPQPGLFSRRGFLTGVGALAAGLRTARPKSTGPLRLPWAGGARMPMPNRFGSILNAYGRKDSVSNESPDSRMCRGEPFGDC